MSTRLPGSLVLFVLGLGACSGVSGLDEERPPLAPDQLAVVRSKSEQAFQEGSWVAAWDEAVRTRAPQERLEAIAIEAMAPTDPVRTPAAPGSAVEMFDALLAKYGGLLPASRARVSARSAAYGEKQRWTQALELELAAADDPPAFKGAWNVYRAAPAWKVTSMRDRIEEAVEEYQAKQAEAAAESDG